MRSVSVMFLERVESGLFRNQLQTPVSRMPSGENLQQLKSDLTTSNSICITSPCDGNSTVPFSTESGNKAAVIHATPTALRLRP
jgi:hypothetical protein